MDSRDVSGHPVASVPQRYRVLAVTGVALLVFVGSVVDPGGTGAEATLHHDGPFGLGVDKLVHAAAYATLALLGTYTMAGRTRAVDVELRTVAIVVLGVAAFGVGIELVQSTLPTRAYDVVDMAANTVGALVGVGAYALLVRVVAGPAGTNAR